MREKELMSARDLWKSKKIYWITSYKALLRYIKDNRKSGGYTDIFKPIIKGHKSGKRYFIKIENVDEFIEQFEANKLDKK